MKKAILLFFAFHFSFFILNAQRYYLYGEAIAGGQHGNGVLFRFDPFTGKDTALFNFSGSNGNNPERTLNLGQNKILYGACEFGGSENDGVLFSYNLNNNNENTVANFTGTNGSNPGGCGLIYNGILYGTTGYRGKYQGIGGVIFSYNPISNKDSTLFSFNDTDGANTYGGLCILNDTSFYGMGGQGGLYNDGVIYRFNPITNKETVLFNFNGNIDGAYSQGTFIKDSNNLLYGLVAQGGSFGYGTLISFDPSTNKETTLLTFNDTNGGYPFGDLFLATDGLLYGMTAGGGSKNDGVLFSYNVNMNKYTIVLNFDSINGSEPDGGNVIEDTVNKILYGMTLYGGKYNDGAIFSYSLNTGKDSVLFDFDGTNGANPQGTLLLVPYTPEDGVNEIRDKSEDVKVYPNPNNGQFTLFLSKISDADSYRNFNVEIYNVLGEKVYSQSNILNYPLSISLNGQPQGVYLYRVITTNGELVCEGKVVVEK